MTPAGTSNELDVQNGREENTHTHTHSRSTYLRRDRFSAELRYDIVFDLDQILRRERGQGNINFPCSAHHEHRISHLTRLIYTLARLNVCVTIVPGADITDKLSGATEPLSGAMFVLLFV